MKRAKTKSDGIRRGLSGIKVNKLGSNTACVVILSSSEVQAQLFTLSNRIYDHRNVVFGVFCNRVSL